MTRETDKKIKDLEEMVNVLTSLVLQDQEGLNNLRQHFLDLLKRVVELEKRLS